MRLVLLCLRLSVALTQADICVVANYASNARWEIISKLLPATAVGVALGSQVCVVSRDMQLGMSLGPSVFFES